jgi:hypothetical protein
MPSQAAEVSTLADVIRLFQRVYSQLGDGTPIMVGKAFLAEPGPGSPPRIVFVPEDGNGKFGPPLKMGPSYIASRTWTCDVAVRGAEGDEAGRFEPTWAMAARALTVLKNLDPGHITVYPGKVRDDSPLAVGGAGGAGERFYFTYASNIAQDPAVLAAIKACITSISPPNPDQPGGSNGKEYTVNAAPDAVRP